MDFRNQNVPVLGQGSMNFLMKNALTRNTELTLNIEDSPTEIPVHIRQAKVFKLFGFF